jgi:hypothetical protein
MKKKRKDPAQRRKRMNRRARLKDARTWLPAQPGVGDLEAYERWYGVNRLCAVVELRRLGAPISEEYEAEVRAALVQSMKAHSAERVAKRAARQRAEQQRAAAKRAEKQRVKLPMARAGSSEAAGALEWTSSAEMGIDAECAALADRAPERFGGYAGRSIEDALLEDARAVDPRVVETTIETEVETRTTIETEIELTTQTRTESETKTKVETRTTIETKTESERLEGGRVRVRIVLEADPEVLARHAWGLIFAISARSFADADADVDVTDYHEWSADDMLRCLAFDRGRLCFAADDVHGRCMQTTIEIDGAGKITLETVDRGEAAMRWIAKLQRKPAPMIEEYLGDGDHGAALEPIPF